MLIAHFLYPQKASFVLRSSQTPIKDGSGHRFLVAYRPEKIEVIQVETMAQDNYKVGVRPPFVVTLNVKGTGKLL